MTVTAYFIPYECRPTYDVIWIVASILRCGLLPKQPAAVQIIRGALQ